MNKSMHKSNLGKTLIWLISIAAIVGMFFIKPIPQPLSYHAFADSKELYGVANFWNVLSNLPFFIVGIWGLLKLKKLKVIEEMRFAYGLLFFGVALVAFGSGFYHLNPNNHTLVWDRLPMTIAFMSLFAIIIAEFINEQKGSLWLFPLVIVGVLSVFYWNWTESNGVGDLRFYGLVQFLPILLIPLILILYPKQFSKVYGYWWLLLFYILAKLLEQYDVQVYALLSEKMSGHAIKHVAAAVGLFVLLKTYLSREKLAK